MVRDDNRYVENLSIDFVMYCDEHGLSYDEAFELLEKIFQELDGAGDSRANYLPKELMPDIV